MDDRAEDRSPRALGEPADGRSPIPAPGQPVEQRAGGAHHGQTAEQGHLGAELVVCGAIRSVLVDRDQAPNTTRPTRPAGTVFGSVIMKNRKISSSGRT